jgi:carboxymethylenebutenolidase
MSRSDLLDAPSPSVAGGTGVGFAAATQPVAAHTTLTDNRGLVVGEATVPSGDFPVPVYSARPIGKGPFPVVLVVSEIFGLHEHIADVARRFAKLGYLAVAPELFVRQGDAKATSDVNTLFATIISKVPDAQVMADLDACVAWAAIQGGDVGRLGIAGFCWGGRITWLYSAKSARVKAGVAWYGRLVGVKTELQPAFPIDVAGQLKAPVLGLYGGADAGIPLDSVEQMKAALAAGNDVSRHSQLVVYPGAQHAFHADYRPNYDEAAAKDGWQRCLDWLREHGVA